MCANISPSPTPPPSTPFRPATLHRYTRWLTSVPAWTLQHGYRAGLQITVGDNTTCYWVEKIPGGYRLHKECDGGATVVYSIAVFDAADTSTWECSCPDYRYRSWRGRARCGYQCKHVASLAAALKAAKGGAS